jgi:hypothetical protein
MSAAGMTIEYSRLKPSFLVSVTCINDTDRGLLWPNVECAQRSFEAWCGRRDSNPHRFLHVDLNHARLPIPPRPHNLTLIRAHRADLYKNTGRAGQAKQLSWEKRTVEVDRGWVAKRRSQYMLLKVLSAKSCGPSRYEICI